MYFHTQEKKKKARPAMCFVYLISSNYKNVEGRSQFRFIKCRNIQWIMLQKYKKKMSKRDYAVEVAPFLECCQFEESTGFLSIISSTSKIKIIIRICRFPSSSWVFFDHDIWMNLLFPQLQKYLKRQEKVKSIRFLSLTKV